jgi:PAS domain S-box-containing protein
MEQYEYPGIEIADASPEDFLNSETFQLLVEAVRDYAIFMLDPHGYIRTWNTGAERNKQYLAKEIIGQHFSIFYTPEDRLARRPEKLLRLAVAEGRVEDEGWRLRKDGTRFWADVILTPLYTKDGKLRGFAKVTRDMTERRAIMSAMEDALSASRAKSAFLANMSHELRTPLNAIIGYAEMLDEQLREVDSEAARDVGKILYSSRHLLSIISDVLDLSRIEAGHLDLKVESVDVLQLAREVVETARPLAERNGNEALVKSTLSSVRIQADPLRLRQILYNVFSNAAKFTRDGKIIIQVSQVHGNVEINISDTGVGMTQTQVNRVFDMFYRVETKDKPEGQGGTGLGLAISRLLVEAMHGTISASSVEGKGSTFTIRLPGRPTEFGRVITTI